MPFEPRDILSRPWRIGLRILFAMLFAIIGIRNLMLGISAHGQNSSQIAGDWLQGVAFLAVAGIYFYRAKKIGGISLPTDPLQR